MKTIYVATSGNDLTGDGSVSSPYQTINKASHAAAAGDTIQIAAGTYHETDAMTKGATAAIVPQVNGVTYNGQRGPNGEWLTIIDPSRDVNDPSEVNGGWAQVTDTWAAGANVWQKRLRYQPGIFVYAPFTHSKMIDQPPSTLLNA